MRLSTAQTEMISRCIRGQLGADTQAILFGSRLDDTARGGDVDLLVESATPVTLRQRALITLALENAVGLPFDIVARQRGMSTNSLTAEREHLANLLEAVQRCAHFLRAISSRVEWPLGGPSLKSRQKDVALFGAPSAFNERFAKLQDTLGAAMRHCALLMSETTSPFLKVLALFEKLGVIDSIAGWQLCRTARFANPHVDCSTSMARVACLVAPLPHSAGTPP